MKARLPRSISLSDVYKKLNLIDSKISKFSSREKANTFSLSEFRLRVKSLSPIYRHEKALKLTILLLKKGRTYVEIAEILNKKLGFRASKSAIGRFCKRVRSYYGK
jgi:hypothetical protein